jgi:uncharacterized protein YjiS (DUF1127 family)
MPTDTNIWSKAMAFLTNTIHTPVAHRMSATIATLMADFANYLAYRKTVSELVKLSNRELDDLGINRWGIKSSAIEAVYGY